MDKNNNPKNSDQIMLPPMKKQHLYRYVVFIGAFLGAILLWFYAVGYDSTIFDRKITEVPVKITGVEALSSAKQFTVADELDITITVTVSGKRSAIYGIDADDLTAVVDVSKVEQAGENTLSITVTTPNGISVVDQTSDTVILYIDEFLTKTVAVKANCIDYVLSDGLILEDPEVNPAVVSIEGPKSLLDEIDTAYVDLTLGDVTSTLNASGNIYLKNIAGVIVENNYIHLSKNEAYVTVPVNKEKIVPVVVSLTGGVFPIEKAVVTLSQQSIKISGSVELIDSIEKIELLVDETTYDLRNPIKITKFVNTLLPTGVEIVSGDVSITAEIKVPDITKKNIFIKAEDVVITQVDGSPAVTVKTGITITVIGYRDTLSTLTVENVIATIDAATISISGEGAENAEISFRFSDGITGVYVFGTYTVETSEVIIEQ